MSLALVSSPSRGQADTIWPKPLGEQTLLSGRTLQGSRRSLPAHHGPGPCLDSLAESPVTTPDSPRTPEHSTGQESSSGSVTSERGGEPSELLPMRWWVGAQGRGPGPRVPSPSCPCSPDGYLYEREAILEYILHQKKEIARQMKVMAERRGHRQCHGFDAELRSRAPPGPLPGSLLPGCL